MQSSHAFSKIYKSHFLDFNRAKCEFNRAKRQHSFEAAKLLLTDGQLRTQLLEMLESSRPVVDSLLNSDGQVTLNRDLIQRVEAYIRGVASRANPEMREELMQVLREANLRAYEGKPVSEVWKEIGRSQPQNRSRNEVRQQ